MAVAAPEPAGPGMVSTIRVEVLGPVRAWRGDDELDLGAPRQRAVLAVLASHAGKVVSRSELIDALWGEHAPASAEGSVHTYIAGLRRVLEPHRTNRAPSQVLANAGSGYMLQLGAGQVDVACFEASLGSMRRAASGGDMKTALDRVEHAVSLWRGTPLSGIPGPFTQLERTRLTELYLAAVEQRAWLMLQTGRETDAVAELSRIVHEHPLREQLRGLLMTALYRCGRQAEALEVYAETRRYLADELGVEPGHELRTLHERILTNDPELGVTVARQQAADTSKSRVVPAQLPHDIGAFTGREREIAQLMRLLDNSGRSVLIAAIDGVGGIGKTALAVHFAHQISDRFPDGQLYVNLRGFDPQQPPLAPIDALGQLLRGLGAEAHQVPADAEEQASMYRSFLAGKRILVVLDNAANTDQVRSLLPGSPTCMVLVTSRNRLGGLAVRDGAHRITLGVLTEQESSTLLVRSVGSDRVAGESGALATLARRCGHLPLALRIIAANLAARPHLTVDDLADALSLEQDRLDVLASPDDDSTAVRAVFSWSYHALKPNSARMFRLLGLHPGPEISTRAAAALAGGSLVGTRRLLEGLTSCHLVEEIGRDRFRLHDLVRVYAAERAAAEEPDDERRAAVDRILSWYVHTAAVADLALVPQHVPIPLDPPREHCEPLTFGSYHEALAWLDLERVNLVAACLHAARIGDHDTGWKLPSALVWFLELRAYWEDWIVTHQVGLAAARTVGLVLVEAMMLRNLGNAYWARNQYDDALSYYQQGLEISRRIGDQQGEASTLNGMGVAYKQADRAEESLRHLRQALEIFSELGDRRYEGITLCNLAKTHRDRGEVDQALAHLRQSLEIVHELGDRRCEAIGTLELAAIHLDLGNPAEALDNARWSCEVFRELGDRHGEARTLRTIGTALRELGDLPAAERALCESENLFTALTTPASRA